MKPFGSRSPEPLERGLGQWQAYVAAGKSKGERARRLAEVPDHYRQRVESHVRTVWQLRNTGRP